MQCLQSTSQPHTLKPSVFSGLHAFQMWISDIKHAMKLACLLRCTLLWYIHNCVLHGKLPEVIVQFQILPFTKPNATLRALNSICLVCVVCFLINHGLTYFLMHVIAFEAYDFAALVEKTHLAFHTHVGSTYFGDSVIWISSTEKIGMTTNKAACASERGYKQWKSNSCANTATYCHLVKDRRHRNALFSVSARRCNALMYIFSSLLSLITLCYQRKKPEDKANPSEKKTRR